MSFVEEVLKSNEKVLYATKPHWIIYSRTITWLLVALLLALFGSRLPINVTLFGWQIYQLLTFAALIITAYNTLTAYITFISSEYIVTSHRVIIKTGFIQRSIVEMLLHRIESVQVSQSITGRMLNYGTIVINGIGGSKDLFHNIPSPLQFREVVQQQIESLIDEKKT